MRFSVRPDPEAVTVDADAGPFPQPRPHLHPRTDARNGLGFEVEGEDPISDRPASQVAGSVPQVLNRSAAVDIDFDRVLPVELRPRSGRERDRGRPPATPRSTRGNSSDSIRIVKLLLSETVSAVARASWRGAGTSARSRALRGRGDPQDRAVASEAPKRGGAPSGSGRPTSAARRCRTRPSRTTRRPRPLPLPSRDQFKLRVRACRPRTDRHPFRRACAGRSA